jgi:membrane associated rhomboid family serine protease
MYRHQQSPSPDRSPQQRPPGGLRRIAVQMPVDEPRLTYALLAVIVLIHMYFFSLPLLQQVEFLTRWGKVNDLIREGEYYRLFTSMFLHLNLAHILFNGYALYAFGRDVEALFGHIRFAIIYFLGWRVLFSPMRSRLGRRARSSQSSGRKWCIFTNTATCMARQDGDA